MESPVYTQAQANKMTVSELKDAIKLRGLPISGAKADLVERLVNAGTTTGSAEPKRKREQTDAAKEEDKEKEEAQQRPSKKGKTVSNSAPSPAAAAAAAGGIVDSLTEPGWKELLSEEFEKPYFKDILQFIQNEKKTNKVFPPDHEVLNAFNYTPWDNVKVVIIGQDPYIKEGQAHGVCFSVRKGVALPPSLKKMYQELEADIPGFKAPKHGYLEEWARQGVLMLNATLTVNEGKANSHEKCGWQTFTDRVLAILNEKKEGIVFLLWGKFAIKKAQGINKKRHHILEAAHPSPLAGSKFLGCKHFSKCNHLLETMGKTPIDWNLSP